MAKRKRKAKDPAQHEEDAKRRVAAESIEDGLARLRNHVGVQIKEFSSGDHKGTEATMHVIAHSKYYRPLQNSYAIRSTRVGLEGSYLDTVFAGAAPADAQQAAKLIVHNQDSKTVTCAACSKSANLRNGRDASNFIVNHCALLRHEEQTKAWLGICTAPSAKVLSFIRSLKEGTYEDRAGSLEHSQHSGKFSRLGTKGNSPSCLACDLTFSTSQGNYEQNVINHFLGRGVNYGKGSARHSSSVKKMAGSGSVLSFFSKKPGAAGSARAPE